MYTGKQRPPISREEIQRIQAENKARNEAIEKLGRDTAVWQVTQVIYDMCVREFKSSHATKHMSYNITDCIGVCDIATCRKYMKDGALHEQVVEGLKLLFPGCDITILHSQFMPDYKGIPGEILTIRWD